MPRPTALDHSPPWPASMTELTEAERFVINSFRRWVMGLCQNDGRHCRFVWREFEQRLPGRDGPDAVADLARLVDALETHARRPIRHLHPCCAFVGADEMRLASLIGACQADRLGLAEDLATSMVDARGVVRMVTAGQGLGRCMQRNALNVPLRMIDRPVLGHIHRTGRDFAVAH